MIVIEQEPLGLQPVNSDHIWTIYDDAYTGYTNYKYVVDFYLDPYEPQGEKIGRVKLRPNTSGKASFNARDIIKNYIAPNPRVQSGSTDYAENLLNQSGFTFTNQMNDNVNYEKLRQIANYRILIGKEYTTTGGTQIDINTAYNVPNYSIVVSLASSPTISWSNANGWRFNVDPSIYSAITSGWTYQHKRSGTIIASSFGTTDTGSYTSAIPLFNNDLLYVWSRGNNCGFYYKWSSLADLWVLQGTYNHLTGGSCEDDASDFKTIWLAKAPNLLLTPGSSPSNLVNSEWAIKYKMSPSVTSGHPSLYPYQTAYENRDWDIERGSFLNTYGGKFKQYNISGLVFDGDEKNNCYIYSRKHHKDCPVIVNWISGKNGWYSSTADFFITFSGTGNNISVAQQLTPASSGSGTFTPANELIQSYILNEIPTDTDWLGYMLSDGTPGSDAWADGNSMLLLYELYAEDCIDDPIHFLFINRHGAFDTYTFSQKNIRSHNTSKSTYAKNGITDTPQQRWGDWQYRNTPYDQTTITSVEAQSTYVDENDVPIIQDLFLSPYVWRIQKIKTDFYLVPIEITSNSVEEYKNRYNKLYQYDMTFNYNPIRQFNNPL